MRREVVVEFGKMETVERPSQGNSVYTLFYMMDKM